MLGEKTKKNLEEAFAGESMARSKYDYYASVARKAGYVQIANIFEETARNEKEHAKLWAKKLELVNDVESDLKAAIAGEAYEHQEMYPRMALEAREEGHNDIAILFENVARVEQAHEARYKKLLENIEKEEVFKKPEIKRWKCNNCGHIHEGKEAPLVCPACLHKQEHFEIFIETY
ncbi:MAG: rubrerythrin family protein [Patescibacteria group bacterium]|nr:rubrerythrin family protein [Patescibacteria group bacterium]MDD3777831.1 rubrerythrin family protein [Patescibacteria group bacterium]MDD3939331.1 rubrerythrin family protein [Patescibacteria group bacterium]MDD4443970.1 rubrerythrin family protein [Patescibacteria group bacterium]NCU39465.1 rubrerythrin family protein [Candidatus Falkowbacteria bacterium]